jgi:hypothetical protein
MASVVDLERSRALVLGNPVKGTKPVTSRLDALGSVVLEKKKIKILFNNFTRITNESSDWTVRSGRLDVASRLSYS